MRQESLLEIKAKFKPFKKAIALITLTPIILAGIACLITNFGREAVFQKDDPDVLSVIRTTFISLSFIEFSVSMIFYKFVFNTGKFLAKFSSMKEIKQSAQTLVKHPLINRETKDRVQKWLDNPDNLELLEEVRVQLFLTEFLPKRLVSFAMGETPSILAFVLYKIEANAPISAALLCLSYLAFYITYPSEGELSEAIQKLERMPVTP